MRQFQNIEEIAVLQPDFIGFIFYKGSPRNVTQIFSKTFQNIQKVGVFVEASIDSIRQKIRDYTLQVVQLHGEQTPEFCTEIKKLKVPIWKAFAIDDDFDFRQVAPYKNICDAFLFDAKGKKKGGNGLKFHWELLKNYKEEVPFFLSGGIGLEEVEALQKIHHPQMIGIDVNSKFEIAPAVKDIEKIKAFVEKIKAF